MKKEFSNWMWFMIAILGGSANVVVIPSWFLMMVAPVDAENAEENPESRFLDVNFLFLEQVVIIFIVCFLNDYSYYLLLVPWTTRRQAVNKVCHLLYVGIAQLVEHLTSTQDATGSSPVTDSSRLFDFSFLLAPADRLVVCLNKNAGIAQLVEQAICNRQVGGSSPSTGPM